MIRVGPDWRFVSFQHETVLLRIYLDLVERQLPGLLEREASHILEEAEASGDDFEQLAAEAAVEELGTFTVPRFLIGAYLISLWAHYEEAVKRVADEIRKAKGVGLKIGDIKDRDFLAASEKYFDYVLAFPLKLEGAASERIRMLRDLRNCYAHANGNLDRLSLASANRIRHWESRSGVEIVAGLVVVGVDDARVCLQAVEGFLDALIKRTGEAFPQRG